METNTADGNAKNRKKGHSLEGHSLVVDSDEINFMVFRYLQESGYVHAAFSFHHEAMLHLYKVDNAQIPPGILLSFVQRGIDFLTVEKKIYGKNSHYLRDTAAPDGKRSLLDLHKYMSNPEKHDRIVNENEGVQIKSQSIHVEENQKTPEIDHDKEDENILKLQGHKMRVSDCKWNLQSPVLASCSNDNTARIWLIPENFRENQAAGYEVKAKYKTLKHDVLKGTPKKRLSNSQEVTAIAWNMTGTTLATGCDDGITRLWAPHGEMKAIVRNHSDSITVLKWSPSSKYFITGSYDSTAAVCHRDTAVCFKRFRHDHPIHHLDWKNDDIFAFYSADGVIRFCSLSGEHDAKMIPGHRGEVNTMKFSTDGKHLASGGDDKTVKIWDSKSYDIVQNLEGHLREIHSIDWAPDMKNPHLATGAFDSTIKIWNVQEGKCIRTMSHKGSMIYTVKYSPDGKLIASGTDEGRLNIWSVATGILVKSFLGKGAVRGIDWYYKGDKLAVCRNSGALCVIDTSQWVEL